MWGQESMSNVSPYHYFLCHFSQLRRLRLLHKLTQAIHLPQAFPLNKGPDTKVYTSEPTGLSKLLYKGCGWLEQ